MNRTTPVVLVVLVTAVLAAVWIAGERHSHNNHAGDHDGHAQHGEQEPGHGAHGHDEHAAEEDEYTRGPHGGRMLVDGRFSIEITLFEQGVPPEFRVYTYADNRPVSPEKVKLDIQLERLGGRVDRIGFSPQADYLRGDTEIVEPHSFAVTVNAGYAGQPHRWSFESLEGRTQIGSDMATEVGIETEVAGPAVIREILTLSGQVQTDPDRVSRVRARFPGVVKAVKRNLGDVVEAGDALASVQSNESLETYILKAPIGGLIVRRDIQVGEATGDDPLFIITDLSEVWAELDVFGRDIGRIHAGQAVTVETFDGHHAEGVIDFVSPLSAHASQSVRARVRLENPEGQLRPGQFVRGRVTIAEHEVPLAVRATALQRFRDFQVVFARFADVYEVRMIDIGRHDSEWVEVLGGLEPGTGYVTANSYLIKADIEKSGASHDH